jgi:hypothetical protein
MNKDQQIGRIAMRVDGDEWKAYYAMPDTMEAPLFLGSVKMAIVQKPERREAFMSLMRDAVADMIEEKIGTRPVWGGPKPKRHWER